MSRPLGLRAFPDRWKPFEPWMRRDRKTQIAMYRTVVDYEHSVGLWDAFQGICTAVDTAILSKILEDVGSRVDANDGEELLKAGRLVQVSGGPFPSTAKVEFLNVDKVEVFCSSPEVSFIDKYFFTDSSATSIELEARLIVNVEPGAIIRTTRLAVERAMGLPWVETDPDAAARRDLMLAILMGHGREEKKP